MLVLCSLLLYGSVFVYDGSETNSEVSAFSVSAPQHPLDVSDTIISGQRQIESNEQLDKIVSISTGKVFDAAGYGWKPGISYAIDEDGTAWQWGYGKSKPYRAYPEQVAGLDRITQITGEFALTQDGQVWRMDADNPPTALEGMGDIAAIQQLDEMFGTLFVLRNDGTVWQLKQDQTLPERLANFADIRGIISSYMSLFLLNDAGQLYYIDGRFGEIKPEQASMVEVPHNVVRLAVGYNDAALIQTGQGEAYAFSPDKKEIVRMPAADEAVRMAVGGEGNTYLIVKADGSVWGWGTNKDGILGDDLPDQVDTPVRMEGLEHIVDVQMGTDHALALSSSGSVFSWGSNMTGQLGRVPYLLDRWTELGTMDGIRQVVTLLDRPYFIKEDGSLWSLNDDLLAYEVKGPARLRTLTGVSGVPITLSEDGVVRIWSDRFESYRTLDLPFQAKDIVGGGEHLLLRSEDDRLITVKFKPEIGKKGGRYVTVSLIPEKMEEAQLDPTLTARVKSLYANHYTFMALTEDGRVYYADKSEDAPFAFKPVAGLQHIRQLAHEYFVRYTLEPAPVWALDENGRLFEIHVNQVMASGRKLAAIEATVLPETQEGIKAISGKLRITADGQWFEQDGNLPQRQPIPEEVRLLSSNYDYAIEGPGSYYHFIVTSSGTLAVIGYNPFGALSSVPGSVVLPHATTS